MHHTSGVCHVRLTKERDEQIELVIERLQTEKEEWMAQHRKEMAVKVDSLLEEKVELEKKLRVCKSSITDLSNTALLVSHLCHLLV